MCRSSCDTFRYPDLELTLRVDKAKTASFLQLHHSITHRGNPKTVRKMKIFFLLLMISRSYATESALSNLGFSIYYTAFIDDITSNKTKRRVAKLQKGRCMFKFKDLRFKAGYLEQNEVTLVDMIKVELEDFSADTECKRNEGNYPKVEIKKVGNNASNEQLIPMWDRQYRRKEHLLIKANPCAAYEVRITPRKGPAHIISVGPYFNDNNMSNPIVWAQNPEYEKNLTAETINITPNSNSVSMRLQPICAKMLEIEVEPETEEGLTKKSEIVEIDPRKSEEIVVKVEKLEPCTKYIVNAALSLKKQDRKEFEEDERKFKRDKIATFSTLPDVGSLRESGYCDYDEDDQILSWDFSDFFDQECARPLKNHSFLLTIGKRPAEIVTEVSFQNCPDFVLYFNKILRCR